jgi:energy-converting hydrogenase Eha subunit G
MTPSPLIANLILPALVGLVVGFSGGLTIGAAVTLRWICRKTPEGDGVPIYHDDTNPTPGRRPWRGGEHFSKLGWVFVILGLLGILLGSYFRARDELVTKLQAGNHALDEVDQLYQQAQQQRDANPVPPAPAC